MNSSDTGTEIISKVTDFLEQTTCHESRFYVNDDHYYRKTVAIVSNSCPACFDYPFLPADTTVVSRIIVELRFKQSGWLFPTNEQQYNLTIYRLNCG